MKNKVFNKFLSCELKEGKEQYIDNLLESESVFYFRTDLKLMNNIDFENNEEEKDYLMLKSYIDVIDGIDGLILLEYNARKMYNRELNIETIERLTEQKLNYIKEFSNWLWQ